MNTIADSPPEIPDEQWETIACPVCAGDSFINLFEKDHQSFVKCSSCELVMINPRPVLSRVLETYDDEYSRIYANKAEKKIKRISRWVNRTANQLGYKGTWLDVGCSVGFVVKTARESGFEAHGIDVQSWGIEFGKTRLHLENLYCGDLLEHKFADNYFDVISMYDVIEHIPDLDSTLSELKRILSSTGIIDIITPDVGHWRTPGNLYSWNEIKPSEHLYYFNINTLSKIMENHGLKIIKKRFHWKPSLRVYVMHK